ncbi:hypothetical protein [Okeania sp. SIO2B3]|uniref:hypothetical protein n=1 Tax=Okeania sp. SIO2B3 TaxID=2607784 RepID=UPI0013C0DE80|nr:hypothetical protein [Okeania sp. SIO2B3]NET45404.1 hypothetical protein [Okeania sp. SIO2B3]
MTDFQTSFLSDVKSLFLQEQEENLAPYLYSTPNPDIENDPANGEGCYQELISQNLNYYLYKKEIQLINNKASQIVASDRTEASFIEFGLNK